MSSGLVQPCHQDQLFQSVRTKKCSILSDGFCLSACNWTISQWSWGRRSALTELRHSFDGPPISEQRKKKEKSNRQVSYCTDERGCSLASHQLTLITWETQRRSRPSTDLDCVQYKRIYGTPVVKRHAAQLRRRRDLAWPLDACARLALRRRRRRSAN